MLFYFFLMFRLPPRSALSSSSAASDVYKRQEFVYVKESAYPLVYKRTGKDETIYIVLNPSGQDVECDAQIPQHAQSVYSNNGEAAYADGKWKVPAASATFLKVEN